MSASMKAPENCNGVSVDMVEYVVDAQGNIEVDEAHVSDLLAHGFTLPNYNQEEADGAAAHAAKEAEENNAQKAVDAMAVSDSVPATADAADTTNKPEATVASVMKSDKGKK